jgi:putative ABC transport system permease protein
MKMQFTLALRYLAGRKLRTALTTLAIMFGVLVLFGMNTLVPSLQQAFQVNMRAAFGKADTTITLKTSDVFSASVASDVAATDGVATASGFLNRNINFPADYYDADPAKADSVTVVTLVGIDVTQATSMHSYIVQEGRFLEATDPNAAVISQSLASGLGVELGGELKLPGANGEAFLTIVGVLPARAQAGNEEVLVTLETAQSIAAMPGKIDMVEANFVSLDKSEQARVQNEILDTLGSNYQTGTLTTNAQFLTSLQLGQMIFSLFGLLALLMGGFIIFNTFRTVVAERRRDIGMLRTLGANRRTILGIILAEGLLQGILGTALGLLVGYLMAIVLIAAVTPILNQFLNVHVAGPVITLGSLILSISVGLGVTLVAGILPAISASRVTPLEALRPTVGPITIRRMAGLGFWSGAVMLAIAVGALLTQNASLIGVGGVLFIVGLFLVTPALVSPIAKLLGGLMARIYARSGTAQLAEGNLSRQPSRAATTASTT